MATIWDDKNHSSGEEFKLSKTANRKVKDAFKGISEPWIKISSKEFDSSKNKDIIDISKNSKAKTNIVFYFKSGKTSYKFIADYNLNNSNFTWSGKGTSTNRPKMTKIKELCSLYMMTECLNNNTPTEEELIIRVKKEVKDVQDYWRPVYYTSALAHSKLLKQIITSSSYRAERQQKSFTKNIYKLAKGLTGKSPDNWNPSDVWFWKPESESEIKRKLKEIESLNVDKETRSDILKEELDKFLEDGKLIGISLKQIDKGSGSKALVSFESVKKKTSDMDFSKESCIIRDTKKGLPAYGELKTKSGFNVKWGGRANATKANINVEGQMDKSTHQLGAIDSKALDKLAKDKGATLYKDSNFKIKEKEKNIELLKEYIDLAPSYFKGMTAEYAYHHYGFVQVKRFIANAAVYNFINSLSKEEIMYCFLLAKKIDKINPKYWIFE